MQFCKVYDRRNFSFAWSVTKEEVGNLKSGGPEIRGVTLFFRGFR